jgi:Zn-dependent peptidase ImmA (M78 family)
MAPKFALYVRSVEGKAVARYGTREMVGAVRVEPTKIVWDTEAVIPLSEEYVATYQRELRRHLTRGELKRATEAEYQAYLKAKEAKAKKEAEALPADERKAIAEATAKAIETKKAEPIDPLAPEPKAEAQESKK